MRSDIKVVRVYAEDWKELNDLLLVEQARIKKRLSFADLIHQLLALRKEIVEREKGDSTS